MISFTFPGNGPFWFDFNFRFCIIGCTEYTISLTVTATTVFVRLGFGLAYTFYLLKRLVIKYLDEITFPGVVDIMCSIVSLLLKYLIQIKFKQILRKLGGWVSIAQSNDTVTYHKSPCVSRPHL